MPFGGALTVGLIGGGLQALQGWLGNRAANQAGDAQAAAAAYAADLQREAEREALALQFGMFEQTREDQLPWLQAGRGGLARLADLLGINPAATTRVAQAQPGGGGIGAANSRWTPQGWVAPPITGNARDDATSLVNAAEPYFQRNLEAAQSGQITKEQAAQNFDNLWRWIGGPGMLGRLGEEGARALADRAQGGGHSWFGYYRDPLGVGEYQPPVPGAPASGGEVTGPTATTETPLFTPSAEFGTLMQGFEAPAPFKFDASKLGTDPGYLFRLREGQEAIERSAAARGGALGGGTLRALTGYGQDMASQEFDKAYSRAAGEYDRDFTNRFNVFNTNQTNKFNRLASLAGVGQTAATTLGNANANYAQQAGNTILQTGQNVGDLQTQIGNARASGYVGGANAIGGALGNIAQMGTDLYGLNRRFRR